MTLLTSVCRQTLDAEREIELEGAVTVVHSNYNQSTTVHREDDSL